jgi:hypothetical protein
MSPSAEPQHKFLLFPTDVHKPKHGQRTRASFLRPQAIAPVVLARSPSTKDGSVHFRSGGQIYTQHPYQHSRHSLRPAHKGRQRSNALEIHSSPSCPYIKLEADLDAEIREEVKSSMERALFAVFEVACSITARASRRKGSAKDLRMAFLGSEISLLDKLR